MYQIGQAKPVAKINDWSEHIMRHFWYCSGVCKLTATMSDEEALKVIKVCKLFFHFLKVGLTHTRKLTYGN